MKQNGSSHCVPDPGLGQAGVSKWSPNPGGPDFSSHKFDDMSLRVTNVTVEWVCLAPPPLFQVSGFQNNSSADLLILLVVAPQGVFVFRVVTYTPIEYLGYKYPYWGEVIGWVMALSSILVIPFYMIYMFLTTPGSVRHVSHGQGQTPESRSRSRESRSRSRSEGVESKAWGQSSGVVQAAVFFSKTSNFHFVLSSRIFLGEVPPLFSATEVFIFLEKKTSTRRVTSTSLSLDMQMFSFRHCPNCPKPCSAGGL